MLYTSRAMPIVSTPIIHDYNPGYDDALGSPELTVKGVSKDAGHLAIDRTVRNAAIALEVAGRRDVSGTCSAQVPLGRQQMFAGALNHIAVLIQIDQIFEWPR